MMAREEWGAGPQPLNGMQQIEFELTLHLERAHELGARARRSNDAVEEQLRRTRQIADILRGVADDE